MLQLVLKTMLMGKVSKEKMPSQRKRKNWTPRK